MSAAFLFTPGTQTIDKQYIPSVLPNLKSPLTIKSQDGQQSLSLSVDNTGAAAITAPSQGSLSIPADFGNGKGLTLTTSTPAGTAGFQIVNGSDATSRVTWAHYVATTTGAGLTADDYEIWAYEEGQEGKRVVDMAANAAAVKFGDDGTEGGCQLLVTGQINGGLQTGQVYDSVFNQPPNPNRVDEIQFGTGQAPDGAILNILGENGQVSRIYDESFNQPFRLLGSITQSIDLVGPSVVIGNTDTVNGPVINTQGTIDGQLQTGRVFDSVFNPLVQYLSGIVNDTTDDAVVTIQGGSIAPNIMNVISLQGGNASNGNCRIVLPNVSGFYNIVLTNITLRAALSVKFQDESGDIIANGTYSFTATNVPSPICSFLLEGGTEYVAIFARTGP